MAKKKAYCRYCRRLVKPQEMKKEHNISLLCPKCSNTLYVWNGIRWR